MIITCGECGSGFVLDVSLLKPNGSKVRCSSCGNIFIAYPPKPADTPKAEPVNGTPAPAEKPREEPVTGPPPVAPASENKKEPLNYGTTPITPNENDPDLTKAVEQIVEDELRFSKEELMAGAPPPARTEKIEKKQADQIPQNEIDETGDEDEMLDFSDFELEVDDADIPVSSSDSLSIEDDVDELDFSDLELELDDEEQSQKANETKDDSGLTFEDDFETEVFSDEEELDFSDLELEMEDDTEAAQPSGKEAFSDDDELDFSDLELELDDSTQPQQTTEIKDGSSIEEELDFSDLELELDSEQDTLAETSEPSLSGDLKSDKESEPDDSEILMPEDEFDFSDLEAELSNEPSDISGNTPADIDELDLVLESDEPETLGIVEEDLDLSDFELELEEDDETSAPPRSPEQSGDLADDLELNLELDEADSLAGNETVEDELDFSDLAGMLDKEATQEQNELPPIDEDIELELELDDDLVLEPESDKNEAEPADEELDFSDLENILDDVDAKAESSLDKSPDEDIELELDLEMEDSDLDLELSSDNLENSEESFDFSDVEAMLEADDDLDEDEELKIDLESNVDDLEGINFADEGDIQLELSMDDSDASDDIEAPPGDDAINNEDDVPDLSEKTMKLDTKKPPKKQPKAKPKRKAKGKGKLIFKIFLILVLILIGIVGVFLSRGKIENLTEYMLPEIAPVESVREKLIEADLPFVSNWVRIVDKDPKGILGLKTSNISGDYITNEIAGELFVIKGNIQNNYPGTRNSISLKCLLKNSAGKIVKSEIVYAGNYIDDEKLKTMNIESINKILKNRLGDNNSNAKIRPGQILRFVVVFSDLNEEFTEFSVEPESSFQGAAFK